MKNLCHFLTRFSVKLLFEMFTKLFRHNSCVFSEETSAFLSSILHLDPNCRTSDWKKLYHCESRVFISKHLVGEISLSFSLWMLSINVLSLNCAHCLKKLCHLVREILSSFSLWMFSKGVFAPTLYSFVWKSYVISQSLWGFQSPNV